MISFINFLTNVLSIDSSSQDKEEGGPDSDDEDLPELEEKDK